MRWWWIVGAAGCVPVEGSFLGALTAADPWRPAAAIGERTLREHATVDLSSTFVAFDPATDYRFETSDPDVLDVGPIEDLLPEDGELDPALVTSDQAVLAIPPTDLDPDGSVHVRLRTGRPGTATLTLVDGDGLPIDAVDVDVAAAARSVAVPMGARRWETLRDLPPISVVGSIVGYEIEVLDASGESLAGNADQIVVVGGDHCWLAEQAIDLRERREAEDLCGRVLYGAGVHEVAVPGAPPAQIEVVPARDVVGLTVREHLRDGEDASEVLVVGTDRRGRPVRVTHATWSGEDPADVGDLLLYHRDEDRAPEPITASWNGMTVHTPIAAGDEREVRFSDDTHDCSTAGGAALGWLALGGLLPLARRRR